MLRMLGLGNERIEIPQGHRWIENCVAKASGGGIFVAFKCADCEATFSITAKKDKNLTGAVQYFEDSCLGAEARLASLQNDSR